MHFMRAARLRRLSKNARPGLAESGSLERSMEPLEASTLKTAHSPIIFNELYFGICYKGTVSPLELEKKSACSDPARKFKWIGTNFPTLEYS